MREVQVVQPEGQVLHFICVESPNVPAGQLFGVTHWPLVK